jgi:hypothetical protein
MAKMCQPLNISKGLKLGGKNYHVKNQKRVRSNILLMGRRILSWVTSGTMVFGSAMDT